MPVICTSCTEPLQDEEWFSMWHPKKKKRVRVCKSCLGELAFGKVPKVTDTQQSGRKHVGDEPSPWGENATRAREGD